VCSKVVEELLLSWYLESSAGDDADDADGYRLRADSTEKLATKSKDTRHVMPDTGTDE